MCASDLNPHAGSADQLALPAPRPARRKDGPAIRRLVLSEHLNPLSLDWRRFLVVEDETGGIAACAQVKPHSDGTREMASLVVVPRFRGKGLARRLIEAILAQEPGPLYLTCRSSLGPFYARFGFAVIAGSDLPPYFHRLTRIFHLFKRIVRLRENLLVMRREIQTPPGV